MVYNDTTSNLGIIQSCEDRCGLGNTGISGDANKLKEFTRYANTTGSQIWHWIFKAQATWRYDDSNQTDLPQGVADLVSGTDKYALPSDALTIQRVEIKDSNDNWVRLTQLTEDQIPGAVPEYNDTDGQPYQYTLIGNTIQLFPAPNYASTGGLKVYFDRASVAFTNTDTTETPGFASEYHYLVAVGASIEWLTNHRPDSNTLARLIEKWNQGKKDLSEFYSMRNKDKTPVLRRAFRGNYK